MIISGRQMGENIISHLGGNWDDPHCTTSMEILGGTLSLYAFLSIDNVTIDIATTDIAE